MKVSRGFKDDIALDKLAEEQHEENPIKFADLSSGTWYKIVDESSEIESPFGKTLIMTLEDKNGETLKCWTTCSLFKKLQKLKGNEKLYLKSLGLVKFGKDKKRYDYRLVDVTKNRDMQQ